MGFLDARRIQDLLERSRKPPGYELPAGVGPDVLQRVHARGLRLPAAFVEWLELTNGPVVGPGAFYGLEHERRGGDLEVLLATHPLALDAAWGERGWIPVTSDGTGNEYVLLAAADDGPVGFFELTVRADEPAYVPASSLNTFLIGLLERELGARWWPFDAERMLEFDPDLARVDAHLLPWSA